MLASAFILGLIPSKYLGIPPVTDNTSAILGEIIVGSMRWF